MKITDYEKVQALAASNIFLLDGPNGTRCLLMPLSRQSLLLLTFVRV